MGLGEEEVEEEEVVSKSGFPVITRGEATRGRDIVVNAL